jgi:hypothetical protein
MRSVRFYARAFAISLAICLVRAARADDVEPGAFSRQVPGELQYTCVRWIDVAEEAYAVQLRDANPAVRLAAARGLWRGRSRRYAPEVLKFLAGPPPGGEPYRAFQRDVEESLRPDAILRELKKGDYAWGAWLAFLRPHRDLVPPLLENLKVHALPETTLALGNSGDARALEPLVELLQSKNSQTAGSAAQALGYFGDAQAEGKLIEALASDEPWLQVKACGALAKMGSHHALPALEKLAKDDRYTGALAVRGMAQDAVASIKKRENR